MQSVVFVLFFMIFYKEKIKHGGIKKSRMPIVQSQPLVWAEINLTLLQKNLAIIRSYLGGHTKLLGVVKHDAYGHGACVIAEFLAANGIDYLGVGRVAEGVELRQAGITIPILVMGFSLAGEAERIIRYQLTPTVGDREFADALQHACDVRQSNVKIHIRVDTSRSGIGVLPEHFESLLLQINANQRLRVEGVFTHPASIYQGRRKRIKAELDMFNRCIARATAHGISVPLQHAVSSPGIFRIPQAHMTMVRCGTALWGLPSFPNQKMNGLQPIMQLKTRILNIGRLSGLITPGYTCPVQRDGDMLAAVLPLGYGDAPFLMDLKDGEVLVRGRRVRILGQPCMGHLLLDVTGISKIAVGDEVVVFGRQRGRSVGVAELAEKAGIALQRCESLCMLGKQITRVYVGENNNYQFMAR
jgi:alanine racemase